MSAGRAQMVRTKNLHNQRGELGSQDTTKASAIGNKYVFGSQISGCKCRLVDWQRIYRLGSTSKLMIQSCNSMSKNCPIHHKRKRFSKEAMYYRQQIPFIGNMLEFTLLICQNLRCPSIGISLRTEARVKVLPLHSFFRKLYSFRLSAKRSFKLQTSLERQDYLLSVARRMLILAFRSGEASPLLHVGLYSDSLSGFIVLSLFSCKSNCLS